MDSHRLWCEICKKYIKSNKKEQHFNNHLETLVMEKKHSHRKNKHKKCYHELGYKQGKCKICGKEL